MKDYSIIKNRKTKQIPLRTTAPLQWKVWKTTSFHDLPQNVDSLNWLEKQEPPTRKKWTPFLNPKPSNEPMMTNSYTYLHNGLSPSPSMPMANKTLHTFLMHFTSNAKKMPSSHLSINTNKQNIQCLVLSALCHKASPKAHILTFTREFC